MKKNLFLAITCVLLVLITVFSFTSCSLFDDDETTDTDEPVVTDPVVEPDNDAQEQIDELNATISGLKEVLDKLQADNQLQTDKNAELEAALKEAIESLEQAGTDSTKWHEATANVTTALKSLDEAYNAVFVKLGFVADDNDKFAPCWYLFTDVEKRADAAYNVAWDKIVRATSVSEQIAAISTFTDSVVADSFTKIDVRLAELLTTIEADGVAYPADKEDIATLLLIDHAITNNLVCVDAIKAVRNYGKDNTNLLEAAAEVYSEYASVAQDAIGLDVKEMMDSFCAKETTLELVQLRSDIDTAYSEWIELVVAGEDTISEAVAKIKKFDKTLDKYSDKCNDLTILETWVDYVTSVYSVVEGTSNGFNALMNKTLADYATDKITVVDLKNAIYNYESTIELWVEDATLGELLENDTNYNVIDFDTLDKLNDEYKAVVDDIMDRADAFVDAVEALEDVEEVNLEISSLITNAKNAWDAFEDDYILALTLDLFTDEDGDVIYDIIDIKSTYEANKALYNGIKDLMTTIQTNVANANKLVLLNYQYDAKDEDDKLIDDKFYSINNVTAEEFVKVFYGSSSYQNVNGKLVEYINAIDLAVMKLTNPTAEQVANGAEGDGKGLYGLTIADDIMKDIDAVKLMCAKVEGIMTVFNIDAGYAFDGQSLLRAEIINDIFTDTTLESLQIHVASIADEYAAANAKVNN